jgi:hypothetical protein
LETSLVRTGERRTGEPESTGSANVNEWRSDSWRAVGCLGRAACGSSRNARDDRSHGDRRRCRLRRGERNRSMGKAGRRAAVVMRRQRGVTVAALAGFASPAVETGFARRVRTARQYAGRGERDGEERERRRECGCTVCWSANSSRHEIDDRGHEVPRQPDRHGSFLVPEPGFEPGPARAEMG